MNKPYVFGIGLPKTGTSSLTAALNCLGIPTLHNYLPDGESRLYRLVEDNLEKNQKLFDPIDQKYKGFVDFMGDQHYETLCTQYPDSVFIYTKREFVSWFESRVISYKKNILNGRAQYFEDVDSVHVEMAQQYFEQNKKIPEFFRDKPHRYLEIDICAGDGWDKLCKFLDLPVQQLPFPHENKTKKQFKRKLKKTKL
jgi:hypothetical protein